MKRCWEFINLFSKCWLLVRVTSNKECQRICAKAGKSKRNPGGEESLEFLKIFYSQIMGDLRKSCKKQYRTFPHARRPASPVDALHHDGAATKARRLPVARGRRRRPTPPAAAAHVPPLVRDQVRGPALPFLTSLRRLPIRRFLTFPLCFILGRLSQVLAGYCVERPLTVTVTARFMRFRRGHGGGVGVRPGPPQPAPSGP